MYKVECICGATIQSRDREGTCTSCGRLFELDWQWRGDVVKAPAKAKGAAA